MNFQTFESIADQIKCPQFLKELFLREAGDKEILINRLVNAKYHEEAFYGRFSKFAKKITDVIAQPPVELKVGDLVTYTNEFGVSFVNNKVLGFDAESGYNCGVYLDKSAYWASIPLDSLTLQDGFVGIIESDLAIIENKYENSFIPFDLQMVRSKRAEQAI